METLKPEAAIEPSAMSESAAAIPTSGQPKRRIFGAHPGLVALIVFLISGVVAWQGGLVEAILKYAQPAATAEEAEAAPPSVNINTASRQDLCTILGVKEKIADDIIAKRPFKDFEEILKVKGIGDKKLAKLKPLIKLN